MSLCLCLYFNILCMLLHVCLFLWIFPYFSFALSVSFSLKFCFPPIPVSNSAYPLPALRACEWQDFPTDPVHPLSSFASIRNLTRHEKSMFYSDIPRTTYLVVRCRQYELQWHLPGDDRKAFLVLEHWHYDCSLTNCSGIQSNSVRALRTNLSPRKRASSIKLHKLGAAILLANYFRTRGDNCTQQGSKLTRCRFKYAWEKTQPALLRKRGVLGLFARVTTVRGRP